ncbi:MAG: ThiF family adenylyltransferase [Myxococcota bacterium]|nr:ThiF family adenylyltransferase [Myxococcota bacterium]
MLEEAQILRYSRQILLRPVGGAGQERLLDVRVGWDGQGAAAAVAAAYLAAGGSGVEGVPDGGVPVGPGQRGFLFGASHQGAATGPLLRQVLAEFNADALSQGARGAVLSEAPFPPGLESSGTRLCLGAEEGGAVVLLVSADDCRVCLQETCALLQPVPLAQATATGALAALVLQRLALGLAPSEGGWTISSEGRIGARAPTRCSTCR